MTVREYGLIGVALVAAIAGYFWLGSPTMAERPFADRQSEIAEKDPLTLTPDEMLTRLELAVRDEPDAAEPHYYIGVLMRRQGRVEDSIRAFQSALRRDDRYVPALLALADVLVIRDQGEVNASAQELYDRVWRLDPTQSRAGVIAALALFRGGDQDQARARWAQILGVIPSDSPERIQIEALIAQAEAEQGG
ncbi:MAG: tetratricopeptide repeat protein [Pseudomonadota bacterium]